MRRRWDSTSSTGEIFFERMLAVIFAMVGKGSEAVIRGSVRVCVRRMRVKGEARLKGKAAIETIK